MSVSPEIVILTVNVLPVPKFEKFNDNGEPVKSVGYIKVTDLVELFELFPKAEIVPMVALNAAIAFGPLMKILTVSPEILYPAPALLFVILTSKDFALLAQKEFPPTISTEVISISCENTSGE